VRSLRQLLLRGLEKAGFRLVRLRHARRGTDPHLHRQTLAAWRVRHPGVPPVILDVGANVGDVSAALHASFPDALVHAFEPSPDVHAQLERRFAGVPGVRCHRLAVGVRAGTLPFETRTDDARLGRLAETSSDATVDVEVTTVDAFLRHEALPGVALLKTDTEGYELDVLQGAIQSLREGRVQAILVEAGTLPGDTRHVPLTALADLLTPLGYALHGLYDLHYHTSGALSHCNVLFVRRAD
jgi:FkbM family methyltransferase